MWLPKAVTEFIECNEQPTQKTETSHNTGNYTGAYITYKTHQTMNHNISQWKYIMQKQLSPLNTS